jgi:hypothetical protein
LAKILGEKSADEAAEQITGLEKSHPLYPKIAETIKKVQAAKKYIRDSERGEAATTRVLSAANIVRRSSLTFCYASLRSSPAKFLPVALEQPIEVISTTIQAWLRVRGSENPAR